MLAPGNVANLTPAWHYSTGGFVLSSRAVANGMIYIGFSNSSSVYAFSLPGT